MTSFVIYRRVRDLGQASGLGAAQSKASEIYKYFCRLQISEHRPCPLLLVFENGWRELGLPCCDPVTSALVRQNAGQVERRPRAAPRTVRAFPPLRASSVLPRAVVRRILCGKCCYPPRDRVGAPRSRRRMRSGRGPVCCPRLARHGEMPQAAVAPRVAYRQAIQRIDVPQALCPMERFASGRRGLPATRLRPEPSRF